MKRDLNRQVMSRGKRVMEFLREEEAAAVDGGLKIVGVDAGGSVYHKLVMKHWPSLDITVINSWDWSKVVAKNNAQEGHVMEIWGYRENAKSCFAFNFNA